MPFQRLRRSGYLKNINQNVTNMTEEKKEITYEVGKTYPFKIRAIHQDFCELVDETGFRVYLQHTNGLRLN